MLSVIQIVSRMKIILLGVSISFVLILGINRVDASGLDEPNSVKNISSFHSKYSAVYPKRPKSLIQGEIIFKENNGYIDDYLVLSPANPKGERSVEIMNFSQHFSLEYDYSDNIVRKINYKSMRTPDKPNPEFISFRALDFFMPFKYGALTKDSAVLEGIEKIDNEDMEIISAIVAKYPYFGQKCKMWQAKDTKIIHRFIIYDDKEEPVFSLEASEVTINPEIEDTRFSPLVSPDFKEVDLTAEYWERYNLLTELYYFHELNALNGCKKMKEAEEKLRESPDLSYNGIKREPSILFADRQYKFLIIDFGKADKINNGDIFGVYRNNRLLGKIQVVQTYEDMSVAEPVTEELFKEFREGDRVLKEEEEF